MNRVLVSEFCLYHLAVHASDVGDGLVLRTYCLASTSVGAVTKAELVHLGNHVLHTTCSLYATLWEQSELRNLRRYEQHSRTVLTSCYASATADARCAVHSLVGILLWNQDSVGILGLTSADGGIATSLHDLIEGIAVYHTVLDDRESSIGRHPAIFTKEIVSDCHSTMRAFTMDLMCSILKLAVNNILRSSTLIKKKVMRIYQEMKGRRHIILLLLCLFTVHAGIQESRGRFY